MAAADKPGLTLTGALRTGSHGHSANRDHPNGSIKGKTPIKIDGLVIKNYDVQVQFTKGTWQCNVNAIKGHRTIIDARESDLGYDLFITSIPKCYFGD